MKQTFWARALATLVGLAGLATVGHAQPIPGVRGIDHIGFTVPDVDKGVAFFHDVIGCNEAFRFGPIMDDKGTLMQDLVNVHPRAKIQQIVMMRCGQGSNIELFQHEAPDQKAEPPKNSDIGGHHIAFYVKNLDAAVKAAKAHGVKTFMGPFPVNEGPAAGQAITYVLTPWGMQLELITYPRGMAYEKTAKTRLWAPGVR